jgi:hypothetical protein
MTFICVLIGWVLFPAKDCAMVGSMFQTTFGLRGFAGSHLSPKFLALLCLCFLWTNWGPNAWDMKMTPTRLAACLLAAALLVMVLNLSAPSPFLYFQF